MLRIVDSWSIKMWNFLAYSAFICHLYTSNTKIVTMLTTNNSFMLSSILVECNCFEWIKPSLLGQTWPTKWTILTKQSCKTLVLLTLRDSINIYDKLRKLLWSISEIIQNFFFGKFADTNIFLVTWYLVYTLSIWLKENHSVS